ncbi:hypothetical protein, conserved [Plasmodium gonderi]|uniref:Cullin family profile domain-containing protein n=1 Tax=Plasmodium gonderi TaxID=77519 RepID=A0A1Y1JMV8_PLAGO|nr:hypothetical protein, conserved [Plasmodium gonderi]GAW81733.1 hypothetical protein, conserved [Plasmodium gonderi]
MDPSSYKNFPVFYLKKEDPKNVENNNFTPNLNELEEYINSCFNFLPYEELIVDNKRKFTVEGLCHFFVFYNCDKLICSIIEKQCKIKTLLFFNHLDVKIENKCFKNGEHFLKHFVQIWNNFSIVIVHLEDLLKSFKMYNKITLSNFECPSYIFNTLWKKYINTFTYVKIILIRSACDYLKYDKIFCESKFYEYICLNINEEDSECKEVEYERGVPFSTPKEEEKDKSNGNLNSTGLNDFQYAHTIVSMDNPFKIEKNMNNDYTNTNSYDNLKRYSVSFKMEEDERGNFCENTSEQKKVRDGTQKGDINEGYCVSSPFLMNIDNGIENGKNDSEHSNIISNVLNNGNDMRKDKTDNIKNIDDKLVTAGLKIINMLDIYDEFEESYKKDTYYYYHEKIKTLVMNGGSTSRKDICPDFEMNIHNLPTEIENCLCHEQIRCRKFFKEETEISILKKLKEILIVRYKDILFKDTHIKHYIMNEKYDCLRVLYLFSLHLNTTEHFCNIFFNTAEEIGVDIIKDVIKSRNTLNMLYDSLIRLVNYKLNIDRIIIISFRYSSYFTKKWKEVFEHFLNKGTHAESYMPVILSIYLNNLMVMYNAGLKKLRKYYIINKQFKKGRNKKNCALFEKNWKSFCNESLIEGMELESTISTDSDTVLLMKKYLKKKKKKKKFTHSDELLHMRRMTQSDEGTHRKYYDETFFEKNDKQDYIRNSDGESSCSSVDKNILVHSKKIENLFKKYHDIGKYIMNIITIILSLFKYLSDKEKFEKYYRIFMCKRLINDKNFNIVLDIKIFKTLKKECGPQFTKKIETILKDMKISSKGMHEFYKEYPHNGIRLLKKKQYSVNVIFNDAWDYNKIDNDNIIYPQIIKLCNDYFCKYYAHANKARNIKFLPLYGLCTLKVNFERIKKKKYSNSDNNPLASQDPCEDILQSATGSTLEKNGELIENLNCNAPSLDKDDHNYNDNYNNKKRKFHFTVTTLQATVLLLFNEKYEYSTYELANLTNFPKNNLIEHLQAIYNGEDTNILIYDKVNEIFKLNLCFKANNKYLIVNYLDQTYMDNTAIPALTQEDDEFEDRSLHIDAAIVKLLKSCGKSSEREIYSYVHQKVNSISNEQIKNRLTSLLNREYISFQNNSYFYEL